MQAPFIPDSAKWFIADIVEELTLEGISGNTVHVNTILIQADNPDTAYEKALNFGRASEAQYDNPSGVTVTAKFRGLRALQVVHDELKDGAELMYEELRNLSETEISNLLRHKDQLAVFSADW